MYKVFLPASRATGGGGLLSGNQSKSRQHARAGSSVGIGLETIGPKWRHGLTEAYSPHAAMLHKNCWGAHHGWVPESWPRSGLCLQLSRWSSRHALPWQQDAWAGRFHLLRLGLYGSVARGDASE